MFTLEQATSKDFYIHMTNLSNQDWDLGQTEVQDIAFIFIFGVEVNICQALIPANYVEYQ